MRKLITPFFLLLGLAAGAMSAADDGWGLRLIMMGIGAMFAVAIGGGLARAIERSAKTVRESNGVDVLPRADSLEADKDLAYLRERGTPPFTRLPDAEPDRRMFDPDRIG